MHALVAAALAVAAAGPAWPPCPPDRPACVRLVVHLAAGASGEPGASGAAGASAFLSAQLAEANRHFAPIGVGFEVVQELELPAEQAGRVHDRGDRDRLGARLRLARDRIHLFVVARLDDLAAPAELRGVHWRQRGRPERRWIILSRIARPVVLAHELGHYFGLPHSTDAGSIMNKTHRTEPPPEARTFVPRELQMLARTAGRRIFQRKPSK